MKDLWKDLFWGAVIVTVVTAGLLLISGVTVEEFLGTTFFAVGKFGETWLAPLASVFGGF